MSDLLDIFDQNGVSLTKAGVTSFQGRAGAITLTSADVTGALTFSPYSAANPTGYITAAGAPVQSVFGRTGAVTLASADVTAALGFTPSSAANPAGYSSGNQVITLSGDATGSGATAIIVALASIGTAGTYQSVTTDSKGRVTAGGALTSGMVATALGYAPASAALASANILVGNAGGTAAAVTVTGDVTMTNAGTTTVGKIGGQSISLAGALTHAGAFPVTVTATATTNVTLPPSGTLATVAATLPNTLSSANIWVGNASGTAAAVGMTGDVTMTNAGATTVGAIGGQPISLAHPFTTGVAFPITLTATASSNATLPPGPSTLASLTANNTWTGTQSFSSGALKLTGATSNVIDFGTVGGGAPTFSTVSVGTKIRLYDDATASTVDFAIGIGANSQWASIPQANSTYSFQWYGGTTVIASLSGAGTLSLLTSIVANGATAPTMAGAYVYGGGNIGSAITAQISGTSGSGTPIRLTANGAAAGATNTFNLAANSAISGTMTVTAKNAANSDIASWVVPVAFTQGATASTFALATGATVTAASPILTTGSTMATASLTVAADTTNGGLSVTVTPPAAVTIHASAALHGAQIS